MSPNPGVYDLCVEALSDRERKGIERDAVVKKAEYAAGGGPEYYILHREPHHQAFYTRTKARLHVPIEPDADGVIHSKALSGCRFRLSDLCGRRPIEVLRDDPVSAEFVLPGWTKDRTRADREAKRAQTEAGARTKAEVRRRRSPRRLIRFRFRQRCRFR